MTSTAPNRPPQADTSGVAVGVTLFAAVLMMMAGTFHVIQGLVALLNDEFYIVGAEYVFQFDVTTWGWIHIIAGLVVGAAGFFLIQGAVWARTVGVAIACLSILANFAWLPYSPLWSLTIIAFDVFVIWALTAHGRDITRA
jgi:hypothetical protein